MIHERSLDHSLRSLDHSIRMIQERDEREGHSVAPSSNDEQDGNHEFLIAEALRALQMGKYPFAEGYGGHGLAVPPR